MMKPHRSHPLWYAYIIHRISGLILILFLPVHFYTLSLVLTNPTSVNRFLSFAEHPLVKLAEFGLVFLLSVHFFGGIRLLALEWLPWNPKQKFLAALSVALAFFISGIFLLQAI